MKILIGLLSIAIFSSLSANALPLPTGPRASVLLPNTFTTAYNFEGTVELSNCSGSLIRLENAKDSDFGLILTNGHCYEGGMPKPGTFITNRPSSRRFTLLDAGANAVGSVSATQVLYATMTKTDMTVYKLNMTYADILSRYKIHPLALSSHHPAVGQPIEVISGYWQRGYSCAIEAFVNKLQEDGWESMDSIRYTRPGCEVIGGTSGSPILLTGTRTVIGVNNTGNEDGGRCTINNPCEIDGSGNVSAHLGYSYAQETYWIYSCLDSSNSIDINTPGCQLFH